MFTYGELMKYKMADLVHLAEFLQLPNIGGLKKTELAHRIYEYYNPKPQEVPGMEEAQVEMSVRVQRLAELNKE